MTEPARFQSRSRNERILAALALVAVLATSSEARANPSEAEAAERAYINQIFIEPGFLEGNGPRLLQMLSADVSQLDTTAAYFSSFDSLFFGHGASPLLDGSGGTMVDEPILHGKECTQAYGGTFDVPFGGYSGEGLVSLQTKSSRAPKTAACFRLAAGIPGSGRAANTGGWSFEPGAMLTVTWQTATAKPVNAGARKDTSCVMVARASYASRAGSASYLEAPAEKDCTFTITGNGDDDSRRCAEASKTQCKRLPKELRSAEGHSVLDLSNLAAPLVRYSDGRQEVFEAKPAGAELAFDVIAPVDVSGDPLRVNRTFYFTRAVTDRNGNRTTFSSTREGWVSKVTDPRGIATTYERDARGRVTSISKPGIGGAPKTWKLTWSEHTFDTAPELGDGICTLPDASGNCAAPVKAPCNALVMTTLDRMTLPDDRTFTFSYGGLGQLVTAKSPAGLVTKFSYGDSATKSDWPNAVWAEQCPGDGATLTQALHKRRLVATSVYPLGEGGPVNTTRFEHEGIEDRLPYDEPGKCGRVTWRRERRPDGSSRRKALCIERGGDVTSSGRCAPGQPCPKSVNLNGLVFEEQRLDASGKVVEKTTYGDWKTMKLFVEWDEQDQILSASPSPSPIAGEQVYLDVRTTRVIHERAGITWEERTEYDQSGVPSKTGRRTNGNVIEKRVLDGAGKTLVVTRSTFETRPEYLAKNLVNLPVHSETLGPSLEIVDRSDTAYDEGTLVRADVPLLDRTVGSIRGNPTRTTRYADAAGGKLPVSTRVVYFENGAQQSRIDGRGNATSFRIDPAACSADHPRITNAVVSPVPGNSSSQPHVTTSIGDCWTNVELAKIDPNGNRWCTQYDEQARPIEKAGPGDALSKVRNAIRDPECATTQSSSLGSGGNGPTTWTTYADLGVPGRARVLSYGKNGSTNGARTTKFLDGLERVVQECADVDPTTLWNGNRICTGASCAQLCTVTVWDENGRHAQKSASFATAARDALGPIPGGVRVAKKVYDALDRTISDELVGSGIPAVRRQYTSSGGMFVEVVTDARGLASSTYTDVLGNVARVERNVAGKPFVTSMTHDVLGRLLSTTGPGGERETVRFQYDGLGRRKKLIDPDLGTWSFEYDPNGNLVSRTDARGLTVRFEYDALDRLVKKTLPPNGTPEKERVITNYYDGTGPTP